MAVSEGRPALLSEFLAALRARGVGVGVREHFEVARLIERWPGDLESLRQALPSILATDADEERLVRETFDELYPPTWTDEEELRRLLRPLFADARAPGDDIDDELRRLGSAADTPPSESTRSPSPRRLPALLRRYWPGLLLTALAAGLIAYLWWPPAPADVPPPDPVDVDGGTVDRPPDSIEPGPKPQWPPPVAPVPDWKRAAALGGGLALALFAWLYWRRTGRDARRDGYRDLAGRLDGLDGPQTYTLQFELAPAFGEGLLDDVAMLLSRQASVARARSEIDVDASLDATLEAGLAPTLVFAQRTSVEPLLIMEDVSVEMLAHRPRIHSLVAALEARGVYLEHWQFDGDADDLVAAGSNHTTTLSQLRVQRQASALLILSSGAGIVDPQTGALARWVRRLDTWLSRAWLHPSADVTLWRTATHELPVPVWPMNVDGLASAARHLATGESDARTAELSRISPSAPVRPLDVNRLRRLLDLAPRRDPELAELLRQRFCPTVPAAAVAEALPAPPLEHAPAIGPPDEDVRRFLVELLERNRPPEGSAAELRWRLDRALLRVHLSAERDEALEELAELARGPLAKEVDASVTRSSESHAAVDGDAATRRALRSRVLLPLERHVERLGRIAPGGKRTWQWPRPAEIFLPAIFAVAVTAATPLLGSGLQREPAVEYAYDLQLGSDSDPLRGPFELRVSAAGADGPPPGGLANLRLYRETRDGPERIPAGFPFVGREDQRGYYYWVTGDLGDGRVGASNLLWVNAQATGRLSVSFAAADSGTVVPGIEYDLFRSSSGDAADGTAGTRARADAEIELRVGSWIVVPAVGERYAPVRQEVIVVRDEMTEALVTLSPRVGCFQLDDGTDAWQARADLATKAQCYEMDSCYGGRSGSPGECFKWSAGPEAEHQPWDNPVFSCYWLSNRTNQWELRSDLRSKQSCYAMDSCSGGLGRSGGGCYKWSAGIRGQRASWDDVGESSKRVFVSSRSVSVEFGGALGADRLCQRFADEAKLGGRWLAWVADSKSSPSNRFRHRGKYVRIDGATVADSWRDLTDGSIDNPIEIDEYGQPARNHEVWTNTRPDGSTLKRGACGDWTSKSGPHASQGNSSSSDRGWQYRYEQFCNRTDDRLYCFEQ